VITPHHAIHDHLEPALPVFSWVSTEIRLVIKRRWIQRKNRSVTFSFTTWSWGGQSGCRVFASPILLTGDEDRSIARTVDRGRERVWRRRWGWGGRGSPWSRSRSRSRGSFRYVMIALWCTCRAWPCFRSTCAVVAAVAHGCPSYVCGGTGSCLSGARSCRASRARWTTQVTRRGVRRRVGQQKKTPASLSTSAGSRAWLPPPPPSSFACSGAVRCGGSGRMMCHAMLPLHP
jgi:hypothetical protein